MTHLISDVGDDAQLINASVMPMVMSDDPGCGLFKRSPDDVSFISEVQTGVCIQLFATPIEVNCWR
jgi:hypothetical protein